jgi:heat shock protein HslJ
MRILILVCLTLIGCSDETLSGYSDPERVYRVTELNGAPVSWQATINFPDPGRAAGQAPCNAWSARIRVPYPWFELGPIAATRRACLQMEGEADFFAALSRATLAEIHGPVLILSDEDGPVLVFRVE